MSSDGGVMLVEQAERRLGVVAKLASVIADDRDPRKVRHSVEEMLPQRVFQIACGYEDCNDANDLRFDPVFKSAVGWLPQSDPDLAAQPMLSRFADLIGRTELYRMSEVLVDAFVSGHDEAPNQVIINIDATDDPSHGQQQLAGFHGYYDEHCYLPLIVTAGADDRPDELLAAVLRPGNTHAGTGAVTVLKRIVARLQEAWPGVSIILRGDSGFARPEIYQWCERVGLQFASSCPLQNLWPLLLCRMRA
ncbi:MAG: IS1380 family transposase [Armatimonadota bacterium]